jgi:sialate O-acetylesterase
MADVRLPKILGSNMVLQRDSEVKIWGWADAGEEIRVTGDWLDTKVRVNADADGNWQPLGIVSAGGIAHNSLIPPIAS